MSACPETERFAALLRSLKSRSGLSYEALARKSGLAGSTLHRYCRGTSVPQDYGSVHRLATVCGAAPDELRTLHRLWALADAARAAAAGAEAGAAERGAVSEAAGGTEPDATQEAARDATQEAEPKAVPAGEPEADAPTKAASAPAQGPAPAPAQRPDRTPAQRPALAPDDDRAPEHQAPGTGTGAVSRPARRPRRNRLRATVVVAAALAAVTVSAWALSSGRSSSGDGEGNGAAGGRSTGEVRPLFSAGCPPVIAMGEHDECVREVQRLLHAKGADIGVDGDFGPQTLRRVTAFQVLAGLQPNGVVAEPTKKALYTSRVRMRVWSPQKVRQRVREVFPEVPDKAVAIADCQSFLDPLHILPNTNGTRNWGLFQISDARLRELGGTPRAALDPEWNIQAARKLWSRDRDFGDWPHCERAADAPRSPAPKRT
ncbi:helix-turn-helix domain-containing protein [Streptomyces cahuitamycinicus]|uniref:helix-turn-helix domain-containing protein n=1 Tax=Streptomyces cahuitamycinicus TaxID=2070367 RepID=UPI001FE99F65|nr:helix-turn-helix domain-containing protein [Streptomyces cahuitamycinicus]